MSRALHEAAELSREFVAVGPAEAREAAAAQAMGEAPAYTKGDHLAGAHGLYQAETLAARQARGDYMAVVAKEQPADRRDRNAQLEEVMSNMASDQVDASRAAVVQDIVASASATRGGQATAAQAVYLAMHAGDLDEALELIDKLEGPEVRYVNKPLLRDHARRIFTSSPRWQATLDQAAQRRLGSR